MKRTVTIADLESVAAEQGVDLSNLKIGEPNDAEDVKAVVDALDDNIATWLIVYLLEGEDATSFWDNENRIAVCAVFDDALERKTFADASREAVRCAHREVALCFECDDEEYACRYVAEEEDWFRNVPGFFDVDIHIDWRRLTRDFESYYYVIPVSYNQSDDGLDFTGTVVVEKY